jgi:hypothetical protein
VFVRVPQSASYIRMEPKASGTAMRWLNGKRRRRVNLPSKAKKQSYVRNRNVFREATEASDDSGTDENNVC